jgi:hypothetical protein
LRNPFDSSAEPSLLEVPPNQLAFGFAARRGEPAPVTPPPSAPAVASAPVVGVVPSGSRRSLRPVLAGRRARPSGLRERSLDELRLEQSLLPYLPPGKRLQLALTDNRSTIVAVKRAPAGYALRIHRMFVGVEPRMLRAIARYVVHNDRRASELIGQFIEQHQDQIRQRPRSPRRVILRTAGAAHDLQAIFDRLNATYFRGGLDARITWGPAVRRKGPQRSIKMGSFAVEDRLIRIHPALDRASVPEFFVAWIVFHEMLHGKHGVAREGGRRCFHGEAFVADERAYPDHDRASAWERAHIDTLLGG